MTRFLRTLALVGLSSYLLAAGACQITGDGFSVLPYIGGMLSPYLSMLGLGT